MLGTSFALNTARRARRASARDLVDLVDHDERVRGLRGLEALDRLARHGAHVRAPVALDLRHVGQTAHLKCKERDIYISGKRIYICIYMCILARVYVTEKR